jgi:hypothetical protein
MTPYSFIDVTKVSEEPAASIFRVSLEDHTLISTAVKNELRSCHMLMLMRSAGMFYVFTVSFVG